MRTYAEIEDVILYMLQDSDAEIFDTQETGYWIEDGLKEFATYDPHIVDVIFKIESRTGSDTTGTSGSLTDTTKDQFVATDDDNEKVIHNTTDNTWAVVKTYTDETVLVLTAAIMASGENYEIYNKRCTNEKQIYIGDVTDYLEIDSVEYPLGTKRNFKVYGEILEIGVDSVADSDLTATTLPDIDVLIRFVKPHKLCQLTSLGGACTATQSAGVTSVTMDGLAQTEIIEAGDELHIADHRSLYTVTTEVTTSGDSATVVIFPGIESAVADTDVVTFVKSTLKPHHEEIFCHLVAARSVLSDYIRHINDIPKGGASTVGDYRQWAYDKLAEVLGKLERLSPPNSSRIYPR